MFLGCFSCSSIISFPKIYNLTKTKKKFLRYCTYKIFNFINVLNIFLTQRIPFNIDSSISISIEIWSILRKMPLDFRGKWMNKISSKSTNPKLKTPKDCFYRMIYILYKMWESDLHSQKLYFQVREC